MDVEPEPDDVRLTDRGEVEVYDGSRWVIKPGGSPEEFGHPMRGDEDD